MGSSVLICLCLSGVYWSYVACGHTKGAHMNSDELQQRHGQLKRARAAIARDEQTLAQAKAMRDFSEVTMLEGILKNRRFNLIELLGEQIHLTACNVAPR